MGLPVRQRRVLDSIESKLQGSDPRLAAMFAIFTRLTREEEMPRIEELRHRAAMLLAWARLRLAAAAAVGRRMGPRHQVAVFFPIALVLMTLTVILVARFGGTSRCAAVTTVATAKQHPASKAGGKSPRRCLPPLSPNLVPIGR